MASIPFLSVIIPAYNEAANLSGDRLAPITSYLSSVGHTWELLVVNDGSTDATLDLLRRFAAHHDHVSVIDSPHRGKAATIITGVEQSRGRYIIFSDMDQATPISESQKLLSRLQSGSDIVIGSRTGRQGAPLFRQVLAYGMVILRGLLLRLPYRDTQCGFKGFDRAAADKIFPLMKRIHHFHPITEAAVNPGFDVELLYLGRKLGFKIAEVPVAWHHVQSTRVRFFRDAFSGFSELLLVRWRSLTGAYHLKS